MAVPERAPTTAELSDTPQLRIVSRSDRRPSTGFRKLLVNLIKPFVGPIEEYRGFMDDVRKEVSAEEMREAQKALVGDGVVGAMSSMGERFAIAGSVIKFTKIAQMATAKDTS